MRRPFHNLLIVSLLLGALSLAAWHKAHCDYDDEHGSRHAEQCQLCQLAGTSFLATDSSAEPAVYTFLTVRIDCATIFTSPAILSGSPQARAPPTHST